MTIPEYSSMGDLRKLWIGFISWLFDKSYCNNCFGWLIEIKGHSRSVATLKLESGIYLACPHCGYAWLIAKTKENIYKGELL